MNNANAYGPILAPAGTPRSLAIELGVPSIIVAKALMRYIGRSAYCSARMYAAMPAHSLATIRSTALELQAEREADEAARLAWRAANPKEAAQQDADFLESVAPYGWDCVAA